MESRTLEKNEVILSMEGIYKTYPDNLVKANQNVHFSLKKGEIHALVGENGAGKTTLMKILCGLEKPDKGQIIFQGKPVSIHSPRDADRLGLGMVHQRFCLIDSFSVADNIVLGKEPRKYRFFYDRRKAEKIASELMKKYGFNLNSSSLVASLSVGEKQRVEILKILYRGSKILALDEPTSLLTEQEIHSLFEVLKNLKNMGFTIIFITHKLDEVFQIADRITVMRDGKVVATLFPHETTKTELASLMVGKEISLQVNKPENKRGKPVLVISDLTYSKPRISTPILRDINLVVHEHEILGVAGVAGNGLGELEDLIGGMVPEGEVTGDILLDGVSIKGLPPEKLRTLGVAYVPSDRLQRGSSLKMAVCENLIVSQHHDFISFGFLKKKKITKHSRDLIEKFQIKGVPNMEMGTLSGGNIQKTVLSREFSRPARFILISEPTWGLDVACSDFVYQEILQMRENGVAILLISSNLDEILALSDTVAVIHRGQIVGVFKNENLDKEFLGLYMLGLKTGENPYAKSRDQVIA
ncbi:MAG: ABC transporter ATP-binding protein [Caldiserica bacterium]|jgi:simple sugar transport system ATP-binding protein|nr:ABC transporter ATP-binding protein [Caldisericota bacterium]